MQIEGDFSAWRFIPGDSEPHYARKQARCGFDGVYAKSELFFLQLSNFLIRIFPPSV
jgi:hypothetical protein